MKSATLVIANISLVANEVENLFIVPTICSLFLGFPVAVLYQILFGLSFWSLLLVCRREGTLATLTLSHIHFKYLHSSITCPVTL